MRASIIVALVASTLNQCGGFAPVTPSFTVPQRSVVLAAKKKKGSAGKGFGKAPPLREPEEDTVPESAVSYDQASSSFEASGGGGSGGEFGLSSLAGASLDTPQLEIDPDLPPEERAKQILRKQYGLRTAEETEEDFAKSQRDAKRAKEMTKQKKRLQQYRQMKDEDFDIFQILPAPLLVFIDGFLKVGTAVVTVLFILAGIGITVEAWAAATGNKLPEDVDTFIVNVIEPNFTPGLFVLLGFSVSLGLFASAQLGSGTSQYSEDP